MVENSLIVACYVLLRLFSYAKIFVSPQNSVGIAV